MKIAFFDSKPYDIASFDQVNSGFGFEIKYFSSRLTQENVSLVKGFDAVCIFVNDSVTEEMVNELYENGVKIIALRCAGYNNVHFKSSFNRIHIVRVPAYSPYAVAEHAAALMMALNRKTHRAYFRTRDANFTLNGLLGFDMHGKTAGVIGTGKIGKVLIDILNGFGMRVLAYDAYPDKEFEKSGKCRYVPLDTLYAESDIISLNCPLTKETEYLINRSTISKMKDGVMIINTGRGKLINTADLIDTLKSGKIGSAGLDVYEEESNYFFEDHSDRVLNDDILARLLTFNNVLITSHQAFFTKEALHAIATTTLQNLKDFHDGKRLENEVCYRCQQYGSRCRVMEGGRCF